MNISKLIFFDRVDQEDISTKIRALYLLDNGGHIWFTATLPTEDREYKCKIFASEDGHDEYPDNMELLDKCWCAGCLKPDHTKMNKMIREIIKTCVYKIDDDGLREEEA